MNNNTQSRKWSLVINNPASLGLTHAAIAELLRKFNPVYFCMSDEIAETGTMHTHVFFQARSPTRFVTVKNRFPTAHIEKSYGSAMENRSYIRKDGLWSASDKAATSIPDSFEEYGDLTSCVSLDSNSSMDSLIDSVRSGMSTAEIVTSMPNLAFKVRDIDLLRQTLQSEKYCTENRQVEVSFLFGATGTGKTRSLYAHHSAKDICRITSYQRNSVRFDAYRAQDILVFEEFSGQIPLSDMLSYLDVYPLVLPARYYDRVACYTKVYITSNLSPYELYPYEQRNCPEAFKAFLRRLHNIIEFLPDGSTRQLRKDGRDLQ